MVEDKIIVRVGIPLPSHPNSRAVLEIPRSINTIREVIRVIENSISETLNPYELLILCEDDSGKVIKVLYPDDEIPKDCVSIFIYPQPSGG